MMNYITPDVNREEFGLRVREGRIANKLTILDLCDALGVSEQTVDKWQRGRCYPTPDKMLGLARLYGTSIEALLVGDER